MSPQPADRFRVLFIEDAFDQALLVKAFFSTMPGFSVTHAQDGDQALRLIESESWDLLVTDLNLPGTDGFAVVRASRAKSPRTPIIVTTGYTQAEYEEQALRAGADLVMIKPLNARDFTGRVRSMLEKEDVPLYDESDVVLVIEGRPGDAEMGCGGAMMRAIEEGRRVVIVPLFSEPQTASPEELKAAALAAELLRIELRVDRTLFGDLAGQRDLVYRTLNELLPTTVYLPAADDRDRSRREAAEIGLAVTSEVETVWAYETATSGLEFKPTRFIDVGKQMVRKMESLAAYQSVGAQRVDLRPRMAQAYARYWGRFMDFTEVEAFVQIRGTLR